MANTKSKVTKTTATNIAAETSDVIAPERTVSETITNTAPKRQYRVKKDLDPNAIITVKNGFQGRLIYKSRRTQEKFVWETFGDEQDMELQELKNAKNASKSFFENNWFLIDDPEVLEYLGVSQYYKYALNFNSFDELFTKSADEIKATISKLSLGQKKSVAYRAKQLISDGVIDSMRVINALEESLSIELIDR